MLKGVFKIYINIYYISNRKQNYNIKIQNTINQKKKVKIGN